MAFGTLLSSTIDNRITIRERNELYAEFKVRYSASPLHIFCSKISRMDIKKIEELSNGFFVAIPTDRIILEQLCSFDLKRWIMVGEESEGIRSWSAYGVLFEGGRDETLMAFLMAESARLSTLDLNGTKKVGAPGRI